MTRFGFDQLSDDFFAYDDKLLSRRLEALSTQAMFASSPDTLHSPIVMGLISDLSIFVLRRKIDCRVCGSREQGRFYRTIVPPCLPPDVSLFCGAEKLADEYDGYPDLAIEVVPSFDSSWDAVPKHALYQAHGTREYWVVDTQARRTQVRLFDGFNEQIVSYSFTCPIPVKVLDGKLSVTIENYLA